FLDLEGKARQYGGLRAQEAYELAQIYPELAPVVDPLLYQLTRCTSKCSVQDIKALYPDSVVNLTDNKDGSFSVNSATLFNQYKSIVAEISSGTDIDISDLLSVSDYQLTNVFPVDP